MNIQAVDKQNNLFCISEMLPVDVVSKIVNQDWLSMPWKPQEWQEKYPRRKIESTVIGIDIDQLLANNFNLISNAIGFTIKKSNTIFWIDFPGIEKSFNPHLDNPSVKLVMQAYWSEELTDVGTTFYNDALGNSIRYTAPHKNNTGYILVNHSTAWHGLSGVMHGKYRVSSYTYFT